MRRDARRAGRHPRGERRDERADVSRRPHAAAEPKAASASPALSSCDGAVDLVGDREGRIRRHRADRHSDIAIAVA